MGTNSQLEAERVGDSFSSDKDFALCVGVSDIREELEKRSQRISARSTLAIADRLLLAYYKKALSFIEPLPAETNFSGAAIFVYCLDADRQKEARAILQILDYLAPQNSETKQGLLRALPRGARRSPRKGRPIARRSAALRALQLQIDTGRTWTSITLEVCDCSKKTHDQSCTEAIRQSVNGLKRFLRQLEVELPKARQQGR